MISDLILLLFPTTQLRNQEIPIVKKPKSIMGLKFHLLKPWGSGGEFRHGVMSVVDAMWVDIIFTIALLMVTLNLTVKGLPTHPIRVLKALGFRTLRFQQLRVAVTPRQYHPNFTALCANK
ncbi:hypothetical protein Goklo_012444 [Gossypium klotzschianum]|uniref:Uncharacterized protein n=1 Tax=Gossypium klotzschianum TaxID=34286 RepID=A0A7J8VCA0_9ROSI|nr:hypothetical protein [Gossypium klotzschianum]